MTLQLIDEITETRGHGATRECIARGSANFSLRPVRRNGRLRDDRPVSSSSIKSGGRGRTSGHRRRWRWREFIMVGRPGDQKIPIAALVGVMFIVVIRRHLRWSSLKTFGRVPMSDILVIAVVTRWSPCFCTITNRGIHRHPIVSALVFAGRVRSTSS
ncbi:MAG: hypothetical protein H7A50_06855 [Akkermansiaceae bacterium]|nr:hypothetical protein [Akkermansiaceae bacterium]